jgi:predicted transcriptional regulator
MPDKKLFQIVTRSGVRTETLLLLKDEGKSANDLCSHFKIAPQELAPRTRELVESGLIVKKDKNYYLTDLGKIITEKYSEFKNLLYFIGDKQEFLQEHDLTDIPFDLQLGFEKLNQTKVISPENHTIFDIHDGFRDNIIKSKSLKGFSSVMFPSYPAIFNQIAQNGIKVEIIVTESVYFALKEKYKDLLIEYLNCNNAHMYICAPKKVAFVVTDLFISVSLFFKNGIFDHVNDIVGFDPDSIEWGELLFDHYVKQSTPVKLEDLI